MALLLRKRSDDKAKKYGINWLFIKRLTRIFRIFFPSCVSAHLAMFLLLVLVSIGAEVAAYYVGLIGSEYTKVLPVKDLAGFIKTTWQSMLYIILMALIKSAKTYIGQLVYVYWREALSLYINRQYFKNSNYYKINVLKMDNIDNPDQRITQDVERLCNQFSSVIPTLIASPFLIVFYTYMAFEGTGYIGPVSIYSYFIIGTLINTFLMAPVVLRTYRQEKLEGSYRFKHTQIRANAESAAFHVADDIEMEKTNKKLFSLLTTQTNLFNYEFWLNVSVNLFNYIGSILSYVVIAVPIFTGVYNNLDSNELYSLISKNSFVCMYLIYCFSQLIDLSTQITEIAGYSHRIGELLETLSALQDLDIHLKPIKMSIQKEVKILDRQGLLKEGKDDWHEMQDSGDESGGELSTSTPSFYKLDKVDIYTPDNKNILIKELSLEIHQGKDLLITGATGSGKTSIFRVLCGLLQTRSGSLIKRTSFRCKDVMFVPQKPFLTDGTLKEQVIYPAKVSSLDSSVDNNGIILQILSRVGLSHLYDRIGGLDEEVDWDWFDVLTPGEMQCLSFARIYFTKPTFAFLDEVTSAVTVAQEERFYSHCRQLGVTLISIGHRETLKRFHDVQLMLKGNGEWLLKDISDEQL
ncbi:lysosomal cobalamin transporter ABCD4-like [Asterias amurensis]|uniref:lysosomal cobalamin transporter ABCD4-like n=1 Tax=Asterias amurensis TaxID=7602 RepID=UPI003AB51E62